MVKIRTKTKVSSNSNTSIKQLKSFVTHSCTSNVLNIGVGCGLAGPAMAGPIFEKTTFARCSIASTSVLRV